MFVLTSHHEAPFPMTSPTWSYPRLPCYDKMPITVYADIANPACENSIPVSNGFATSMSNPFLLMNLPLPSLMNLPTLFLTNLPTHVSDESADSVSDEFADPDSDESGDCVSDEFDNPVSDESVDPVSDEFAVLVCDEFATYVSDEFADPVSDESIGPASEKVAPRQTCVRCADLVSDKSAELFLTNLPVSFLTNASARHQKKYHLYIRPTT